MMRCVISLGLLISLPGCAAVTAYEVATTPVRTAKSAAKTVGKTYDVLTTSQGERDQKLGRSLRKRQERHDRLERRYREQADDCADGDDDACDARLATWEEMMAIRRTLPPDYPAPER